MRILTLVLGLAVALLLVPFATAEEPPTPRLDGIDYANPKTLITIGGKVGAGQRTEGIAKQLAAKATSAQGGLSQIVRWVARNLREEAGKLGSWRTADQILIDGTVSGEAERAMMIGVLARAAGYPAAWVKTLPIAWLREHRETAQALSAPVGRTFVEVLVGKRWVLLDPVTARLYETYDTRSRELPDDHLAFDKGSDAHALVLSNRFDLWRTQVLTYANRLTLPKTPWATARDLLAPWRIYITGRGGPARYARAAGKTLGYLVEKTFDTKYDKWLKAAAGKTLIVTVGPNGPNLPKNLWRRYLGEAGRQYEAGQKPEKTWIALKLSDGTRVILINVTEYGPVELAVSEALDG